MTFRKEREQQKDFFYQTYDTVEKFGSDFRRYLAQWLRTLETVNDKTKKSHKYNVTLSTEYNEDDHEWLKVIMKYDNWNLAHETAEKYIREGKTLEAEVIYSQITQRSNNPTLIAKYGKYLRRQGRLHHALNILKQALGLAIIKKSRSEEAYCLRQIGRVYEYMGDMKKALEYFERAKTMFEEIDQMDEIARTYRDIGFTLNKSGKPYKAIEKLQTALSLYEKTNNEMGQSACCGCMGTVYKDIGKFNIAEEFHLKALKLQEKLVDGVLKIEALAKIKSNLGVIKRLQGHYEEAIALHENATEHYKTNSNQRGLSREYSNIGVILRRTNRLQEALNMHNLSLELERKNGNERGIQIQLSNIGLIKTEMKLFDQAEIYFKDALKLSQKLGDKRGECHQYKHIARLYFVKKDYDKSEIYVKKGLKLDQEFNNEFGIAMCHKLLGEIYIRDEKKLEQGKLLLKQALKTVSEMNMDYIVEEIKNLLKMTTEHSRHD